MLRRRDTLEDAGLLERVGVDIHPDPGAPVTNYSGVGFDGLGLQTNLPFDLAYKAAEAFTSELRKAHESSRVHEDDAPSAHLFELRLWSMHGRKDVEAGSA